MDFPKQSELQELSRYLTSQERGEIDRLLLTLSFPRTRPSPIEFAQQLSFIPDAWQADILQWGGNQLLLNCARQSGKSTVTALLALYRAFYFPRALILLVSPSLRQSGELFRKVTDWSNHLMPRPKLIEDNRLSCTFQNESRIVSLPSSESTVRGFSAANLVIFDEAARIEDNLYFAMRPMLAISGGQLIAASTPFGKRGWWWEAWSNGGEDWRRIQIRAEECPRYTAEFLAGERRAMGDWWYDQEYNCSFRESIDRVFDFDTVMGAMSDEVRGLFEPETPTLGMDENVSALEVK